MHGENHDAEICAPNSPPSCPRLSRASTPWHQSKAWMAGTSPAMTNIDSVQVGMTLVFAAKPGSPHPRGRAEFELPIQQTQFLPAAASSQIALELGGGLFGA